MGVIFEAVTGAGCYMSGSPVSTCFVCTCTSMIHSLTVGSKSDGTEKEKRQNSHGMVAGSGSSPQGNGP